MCPSSPAGSRLVLEGQAIGRSGARASTCPGPVAFRSARHLRREDEVPGAPSRRSHAGWCPALRACSACPVIRRGRPIGRGSSSRPRPGCPHERRPEFGCQPGGRGPVGLRLRRLLRRITVLITRGRALRGTRASRPALRSSCPAPPVPRGSADGIGGARARSASASRSSVRAAILALIDAQHDVARRPSAGQFPGGLLH
jgi:hypothetical protein